MMRYGYIVCLSNFFWKCFWQKCWFSGVFGRMVRRGPWQIWETPCGAAYCGDYRQRRKKSPWKGRSKRQYDMQCP